MDETKEVSIFKTPEELEAERLAKEPTPEDLQETIRVLRIRGDALPSWLLLKQLITICYILLTFAGLYWGLSAPFTVKTVVFTFCILLDFILIDYYKLINRVKKMIRET